MQDVSLSIPALSLITLMIPAAILLLFFSSLFCIFLLVSCGLSTININNLGNCLLLLKSIPVLLLLSAGPGPKCCYDGDQTKETKWNEDRGKQAPHPSAPCEFSGDAQSLRNTSTKCHWNPFFHRYPTYVLPSWCWQNLASVQEPHKVHPSRQSCSDTGKGDWQWKIHHPVPLQLLT